ncbi:4Fe-4S dicluster domain-containing protein [Hominenteromicrobium sp.]|uniref:4Fe-4S dicluster domain-containing protein n=1 Tax=Hominenteromicrobium sp. TaxID=3073581 RepID=UPI00399B7376
MALACHEPEESCFCRVFGVDCAEPDGGRRLLDDRKTARSTGSRCTAKACSASQKTRVRSCSRRCRRGRTKSGGGTGEHPRNRGEAAVHVLSSLEGWNGEAQKEKFDSPLWEELYKPCLACGTCTFVCPTCQCYDIKDYDTGHGVQRYRCWDSCMYSDFTMMAHGNNRTSQMQRFRQRFMHKLVYFPANNDGMYSCVGCGRCVEKCPASLNIVKVIKKFSEEKAAGGEQQ